MNTIEHDYLAAKLFGLQVVALVLKLLVIAMCAVIGLWTLGVIVMLGWWTIPVTIVVLWHASRSSSNRR